MGLDVITEFLTKATVRIRAYIYNDNDELVDPTPPVTIDIYDAEGEQVVTGDTMTKAGTGIYEYYHKTTVDSPTGWWRGVVWTVDGSGALAKTSEGSFGFKVKS